LYSELIFDPGLVDEHDRDVVTHRVHTPALDTLEPVFIVFRQNLGLANGTDEYFQQFFADWHEI
jgi:hypothetical protein